MTRWFPSADKKRRNIRRQLAKFAMDCAEDFFVWLFRRQHPNPRRRRRAGADSTKKSGFGGGGASL